MARASSALVLALAFALGLGSEAFAVRSCPHHHPDREGAPPPAQSAGWAGPSSDAPGDRGHPPRCMCIGTCTTAASTALPALGEVPVPSDAATVRSRALSARSRRHVTPSPYLLPFPNGPPAALA